MRFLKRNQVIIAVIAFMLITAGYLNFSNNNNDNGLLESSLLTDSEEMAAIGDATLVSSNPIENINSSIESNILNEKEFIEENQKNENNITQTQITSTSSIDTTDEYFTRSRLERDTMYSQIIDTYQKILDKDNISETQKVTAQKEITNINNQKNALMITENLIKTKGFEDIIIFINDKSINAIVKSKELKSEQIAQIQNIITRELNANINNIHISKKE